jgi:class 3 adenylate cyclase
VFVGRREQSDALARALEAACAGAPQVVLVVGEAGIGKSRLVDEFMPIAIERGVRILNGTCQEDVGVPYLPIATALAELYDPDAASHEDNPFEGNEWRQGSLRTDDADLAADIRLQLFLSASRTLLAAAAERATMLVIEDLHWIDDATLGLLRHLVSVVMSGGPTRLRLLVLITSREPEPSSTAGTYLARLMSADDATAITLDALDARESRELVAAWMPDRPPGSVVDDIVDAAAGNPLVIRSVVTRVRSAGFASNRGMADLIGSTDLDQELWDRYSVVSDACGEMLVDAALLGDDNRLDVLAAVCDLDETSLGVLIDEASEHQLMVSDGAEYRFDHPQLRQLIAHGPSPDDRARRHRRISDRLEQYGRNVLEIAHHVVRAGDYADPERVVEICDRAADGAAAIGAWREAARYAMVALRAGEHVGRPEDQLASMQLRAGYAALLGGDRDSGLAQLDAAAHRAEDCGAIETWGRALAAAARERASITGDRTLSIQSLSRLEEFLVVAGDRWPTLRAEVYALQAEICFAMNDLAAARRHATVAEEMAARLDDDSLRVKIAFARGLQQLGAIELAEARSTLEVAAPLADRLSDPSPYIWCTSRLGLLAYITGALDTSNSLLGNALDRARSFDVATEYSMASSVAASLTAAQGRYATCEAHAERARRACEEAEYGFTPLIVYPTLAAERANRGDGAGAHRALDEWEARYSGRSRRYRPLVDALVGDVEAATATLRQQTFRRFTGAPRPELLLLGAIAAQVELGALTGMVELIDGPLDSLLEVYERGVRFTVGWPAFVPRVIALGLAAMGDVDRADEWFDRSLVDANTAGAMAEIARTALDHARVLSARKELARAKERARAARTAYAALAVQPRVEGAVAAGISERAGEEMGGLAEVTRIVLVTDLVGSTALNDELGDRAYLELLARHDQLIRERLVEHDGVEFKHTGDGIAAWFFAVDGALLCASAIVRDFENSAAILGRRLEVRTALTAGSPSPVDGDLFGVAVTLAFRLADIANSGDVLVTPEVAGLARGMRWTFETLGAQRLKGLRAPVEVSRARRIENALTT